MIPHHRNLTLLKEYHFHYRNWTLLKQYDFRFHSARKNKGFLASVTKMLGFPRFAEPKTSLGVMVFERFSKSACF